MSDPADQLSAQGPIAVSQSQVRFIIDALRAGERAIVVSGQNPSSALVPDEAIAACVSASRRVLHIGYPLPSLLELQDMIGSVAGITGGFGIAPQAMARLLLTSVPPWQSVVLAIDDADTLPRKWLYYLAQLSNALAGDAPILQIVLAAGPALLEQLSHPDFEIFRNRIVVSSEKNSEQEDDRMRSRPAQARDLQVFVPRSVQLSPLSMTPRQPLYVAGRVAHGLTGTDIVAVVLAIGCLLAIGYAAFLAYPDSQPPPSASTVNANALQEFEVAPKRSPLPPPDAPETDKAIASLIDQFEAAMAQELSGTRLGGEAANLADRIETLAKSASPNGRLMVVALKDRIATKVIAALGAGRSDEAHRLAQFLGRSDNSWSNPAPTAAETIERASSDRAPSQNEVTAVAQAPRLNDGGETHAAGKTDQPITFPNFVEPAAAPATTAGLPVTRTQRPPVAAVQGEAATAVAVDLPAFAPVRVVLTYPRNDKAAAERAAAMRQALTAAKVEVVNLEAVDASRPTPGIGYYFRSDRDAAVDVSRRVEPLLGRVEPVVLERRGKVPPGTIEIAVPRGGFRPDAPKPL
jgi:hypothetical protein